MRRSNGLWRYGKMGANRYCRLAANGMSAERQAAVPAAAKRWELSGLVVRDNCALEHIRNPHFVPPNSLSFYELGRQRRALPPQVRISCIWLNGVNSLYLAE